MTAKGCNLAAKAKVEIPMGPCRGCKPLPKVSRQCPNPHDCFPLGWEGGCANGRQGGANGCQGGATNRQEKSQGSDRSQGLPCKITKLGKVSHKLCASCCPAVAKNSGKVSWQVRQQHEPAGVQRWQSPPLPRVPSPPFPLLSPTPGRFPKRVGGRWTCGGYPCAQNQGQPHSRRYFVPTRRECQPASGASPRATQRQVTPSVPRIQ